MGLVEQGKRFRRKADRNASILIVCVALTLHTAMQSPTLWHRCLLTYTVLCAAYWVYRWVVIDRALHHPLIYLVALQDEFGGES